ncbi:MAG: tRNA-binding protein [Euryarchaeota archaeon]|nr:tRNA-binding protein [Euryarchaeota archaeon]|tara:strand:+ start:2526 stop:2924 length:399 start_codon:yes stop_codon:yes gene_type:complete
MTEHIINKKEEPYHPEILEKKEYLGIEGFFSVDMRVGLVLDVEEYPEMRKPSYKIKVNFGPMIGKLWTSAQVTNYTRGELIGKKIIGVINLGEKTLPKGFISQFLLLGTLDPDGTVKLLRVHPDTLIGSIVS